MYPKNENEFVHKSYAKYVKSKNKHENTLGIIIFHLNLYDYNNLFFFFFLFFYFYFDKMISFFFGKFEKENPAFKNKHKN
jgi:hypothetical protein